MRRMSTLVFAAALVSSAATAQVTSIATNNPAPKGGRQDLNRIVCEVDETTGTRLGARKVCKTVADWQDLRLQHRERVEEIQRMGTSVGCQEGQACVPGG